MADGITVSRILAAPLLLAAAASGLSQAFIAVAMYGFITDAGDGAVARTLNSASERGARLDSRADFCFYSSVLAGLVWLFPVRLAEHLVLLGVVAVAYATPIAVGWLKFRRLTSYHTLLARLSVVSLAVGLFSWLLFDEIVPLWAGAIVLVVSAVEELVITRLLATPRDNIPSVFRLFNNNPSEDIHAYTNPWRS